MLKRPQGKCPKNCFRDPKSPNWQYDFTIAGERERGTTRTSSAPEAARFVEARRALMRQRQAAASMGIIAPVTSSITLFEACELYEKRRPETDPTTAYQIENLCALLCPDGRDRNLSQIGTSDFVSYRATRLASSSKRGPLRGSTVNREIELARRVWKYALALERDIGRMPNWKEVIHKGAEHKGTRYLSDDETARLLSALRRTNLDLAKLAEFSLLSGQRKSSVVGLRWSDIDFDEGVARFILKTHGEKKDDHIVPLTTSMLKIINGLPRSSEFVFTYQCVRSSPRRKDRPARLKGERYPFSKQGWTRQWRNTLAEAGIEAFRWHDLRHTAATRLLRGCKNLRMVQEFLGHSCIQQTARYAHVARDDLRAGMQQLEDDLTEPQVRLAA